MWPLLQILDKIGCISAIIGSFQIGHLNKDGYLWFTLCNVCYGIIGYNEAYWGLVVMSFILFGIDMYCYAVWANGVDKDE